MSVQPIRPLELMKDENITTSEFTDFIGIWENFVPASRCQAMIDWFEHVRASSSLVQGRCDPTQNDIMDGTGQFKTCLLYTSPSPRDQRGSRMPSSA